MIRIKTIVFATLLTFGLIASAQNWVELDTFDSGTPSADWEVNGILSLDADMGFLRAKLGPTAIGTSTAIIPFDTTFSTGKFTVAFDFYLPDMGYQNQAGFGVNSASLKNDADWGPIGKRNRFQTVNADYPQNVAKVPEWTTDIFGTTETGIWYNVWVTYDLDPTVDTITVRTKKAIDASLAENLTTNSFDFNDENNDDWSALSHFGIGVGLFDGGQIPEGLESVDSAGLIIDNIYYASGEETTDKPTTVDLSWQVIDTFSNGTPDATWDIDTAANATFDQGGLIVTATEDYAGVAVDLPQMVTAGDFTVAVDMKFPGQAGDFSDAAIAVISSAQQSASGVASVGGDDRFISVDSGLTHFSNPSLDLLGSSEWDTWYHVWFVYDIEAQTVEVYSMPMGALLLPSDPAATFDLSNDYTDFSALKIAADFADGNGIKVDNIYYSLGSNTTLSPTAGEVDEGVPECDSIFLGAAGDKDSHLGMINDASYPYVYVYDAASWIYVDGCSADSISTDTGYYFYSFASASWAYGIMDAMDQVYSYDVGVETWIPVTDLGI